MAARRERSEANAQTGQKGWNPASVRELRRRLGLSQQAMARELGVRQQTVSDWEQGLYSPRGASARVLSMVAERQAPYTTGGASTGERAPKGQTVEGPERRLTPRG